MVLVAVYICPERLLIRETMVHSCQKDLYFNYNEAITKDHLF